VVTKFKFKAPHSMSLKSLGKQLVLPTMGRAGHLTPEQESAFVQFKSALEAESITGEYDDNLFLRFLRARKFEVEASKKMFTEYHTWRKEYEVDSLRDGFQLPEYPISIFRFHLSI
jgi:hypothetical protein